MTAATTDLAAYPARYFAGWNQRDLAAALSVISEAVHWEDPSLPAPITDHEQTGGFFTAAGSGFPDLAMHPVGFPTGVAPTGRGFDVPGFDVWQIDDDRRAVSVHAYWNVGTLLAQLGLG
ncbi:MAG TPA: nuclear transport factor 2 family protein [Mycobacterium sp.]|jgi:hypothetical protein|nr:nuclear transport factor 2 family protein [Mycobacterium sp.]